jgi:hypothetical protein
MFSAMEVCYLHENVKAIITWWDTSFKYMKNCYLSNKYLGYQQKITVGKSSGGNVSCGGHCNNDFGDIRFIHDNATILNYWIQNYTSGVQATIWVNNFYNDSCINMYYGKPTATSISNGTLTFLLFDDFLGTALNSTIWKTTGAPSPTFHNSEMYISTLGTNKYISSYKTFSQNTSVSARSHYKSGERSDTLGYGINNPSPYYTPPNYVFNDGDASVSYFVWCNNLAYSGSSTTAVTSIYKIYTLDRSGATRVIGKINGTILSGADSTTNTPRTAMNVSIGKGAGSEQSNITIDWIFVSTIRATKQAWSSFGSEISAPYKTRIDLSNNYPTMNTVYDVSRVRYNYMNVSVYRADNKSLAMTTIFWVDMHYLMTDSGSYNGTVLFSIPTYWKTYNFSYSSIHVLTINCSDIYNYTNASYIFSYDLYTGIVTGNMTYNFTINMTSIDGFNFSVNWTGNYNSTNTNITVPVNNSMVIHGAIEVISMNVIIDITQMGLLFITLLTMFCIFVGYMMNNSTGGVFLLISAGLIFNLMVLVWIYFAGVYAISMTPLFVALLMLFAKDGIIRLKNKNLNK